MTSPVFKIVPTAQIYDWGKIGTSSKVAQFATASNIPGFKLDESAPYAELWMGTHTKSPSRVLESDVILQDHLANNPELIGQEVIHKFRSDGAQQGNMPFLFKVLAIEKALSIQSHPNKETAAKLHAEQPEIYKDPNHKPEMAIALTPFTALCGFMPLPRIAAFLRSTPEFAALVPKTIADKFHAIASSSTPTGPAEKMALKDVFSALMTADEAMIKERLAVLLKRYKDSKKVHEEEIAVRALVQRLDSQFPGDVGTFCAFVLNYVALQPGEAIFLGAGEPHAYVTGDIMECMANSDNVIRAGLTPKLRDIPNLVSGLTYNAAPPANHVVKPRSFERASSRATTLYDPPIPEFSVLQVMAKSGDKEKHESLRGPSIAIVTEGSARLRWGEGDTLDVNTGDVFFVAAGVPLDITSGSGDDLVLYRAFVEAD